MKTKGFTLLEIVIAIAVLAIISLILATIIIRWGIHYKQQETQVGASLSNRFVLDEITTRIRESRAIADQITVDSQTYTSGSTILVLKPLSIDAEGNTIAGTYDHIIFYQDSAKLIKKVVPNAISKRLAVNQILTVNLKQVTFSYDNSTPQLANSVTIELTTKETQGGQTKEAQDQAKATLRNF
jgi:prepilin-type N-terminal cleavage/methylation domain-containing protein